MSTRVLVNTASALIQAASDEDGGGGLVGQRTWAPLAALAPPLHVYIQICFQAGMLRMKSQSPKFA